MVARSGRVFQELLNGIPLPSVGQIQSADTNRRVPWIPLRPVVTDYIPAVTTSGNSCSSLCASPFDRPSLSGPPKGDKFEESSSTIPETHDSRMLGCPLSIAAGQESF